MGKSLSIQEYIDKHKEDFLEELFKLIRIPSVSSQPEHAADMQHCAELWADLLLKSGMSYSRIIPTAGNPVVFAEKIYSLDAPTVLVYGHYDVMPEDPVDKWISPAFEPEVRNGLIYARGADDDKGQSMAQVKGFEVADRLGLLRCNVKVILEGEEEIGSPSLEAFCQEHRDLLSCDVILVSDTAMVAKDIPSITVGLRGICYWEIKVQGPNRDLHSGKYGGAIANPLNVLCSLISQLTDSKGKVTIPEFYDDIIELSDREREMISKVPFDEEGFKADLGISETSGELDYTVTERLTCRPTLDLCGIFGGYTGDGAKTILPSEATAKVSCRLVANQDHVKIEQDLAKYIKDLAPKGVKVTVQALHGGKPYLCPVTHPAYQVAEEAYAATYGVKPIAMRSGGSIPIISTFEKVLGVKSILMGFGLNSDDIHSPNENFPLDNFYNGIRTVAEFYARYGHGEQSK